VSRHRLIVTGGAGFIGSATIWQLNKLGYDDILVVDALRSGDKWKNLVGLRITDALHKDEFLATLRRNSGAYQADTVIHFGACSSTTERDADYLLQNNTHYTSELCDWSLERHANFIYASSRHGSNRWCRSTCTASPSTCLTCTLRAPACSSTSSA
jgi:ADP-L-glycero-D-manno-heptose 6-epimerase